MHFRIAALSSAQQQPLASAHFGRPKHGLDYTAAVATVTRFKFIVNIFTAKLVSVICCQFKNTVWPSDIPVIFLIKNGNIIYACEGNYYFLKIWTFLRAQISTYGSEWDKQIGIQQNSVKRPSMGMVKQFTVNNNFNDSAQHGLQIKKNYLKNYYTTLEVCLTSLPFTRSIQFKPEALPVTHQRCQDTERVKPLY